jgi:cytokinin riboside 5'-monophosphate phosphoribohydrolase
VKKYICVYCSSSDAVNKEFFDLADKLGKEIAVNNFGLVYGGARIGLMGRLAQSVKENNGKVIGVIPQVLHDKGLSFKEADELIITKDMRERKQVMEDYAHAFIGLPGGFGTLEEILEILTLKQLKFHNKAVIFLNIRSFFDSMLDQFEHIYNENFAKEDYKQLYYFTDNSENALKYIETYEPVILNDKWYK